MGIEEKALAKRLDLVSNIKFIAHQIGWTPKLDDLLKKDKGIESVVEGLIDRLDDLDARVSSLERKAEDPLCVWR